MARGPKPAPVTLSSEERAAFEALVPRRSTGQALVQRARIVLACSELGATNARVARALEISRPSVTTWRPGHVLPLEEGVWRADALRGPQVEAT